MDAKKQDKYVCSARFDSLAGENGGKYRGEAGVRGSRNCRRGVGRVETRVGMRGRGVGMSGPKRRRGLYTWRRKAHAALEAVRATGWVARGGWWNGCEI